jgi:hypothetical protein
MSTTATAVADRPPLGPRISEAVDLLARLDDKLAQLHKLQVEIVDLAGELSGSGVVEKTEGLPLDLWLALEHRLTRSERWMLLEVSRVLSSMPATRILWAKGKLSWSQVRAVVCRAGGMARDDREILDSRVEESVDLVDRMDPDQLCDAVSRAADELEPKGAVRRREREQAKKSFLHVQGKLDGGIRLYAEYDPVAGAGVVNAIEDAAGLPHQHPEGDDDGPRARSRQRAEGLKQMAEAWLGGGSRGRAKPLMLVHVDLRQATPTGTGLVEVSAPGGLKTITSRAAEILAEDADMRAVIFDQQRPLGVSDVVHAKDIPTKVRIAVRARDRGCRFPGSRAPAPWTDAHHLVERSRGGTHDPDNITLVSRTPHVRYVHRYGWKLTLDPHTGEVTARRGGRTYRSLPWGTPLRPSKIPRRRRTAWDTVGNGIPPPGEPIADGDPLRLGPQDRSGVDSGTDPPG